MRSEKEKLDDLTKVSYTHTHTHTQIQLETRLRSEKEKFDDLTKVSQSKDEQIAHLRRCVKSILERLGNDVC